MTILKIEFCPLCNFMFIRPTLIRSYPNTFLDFWYDDWYNCPLCGLVYVAVRRYDEIIVRNAICKNMKDFEETVIRISDSIDRARLKTFEILEEMTKPLAEVIIDGYYKI